MCLNLKVAPKVQVQIKKEVLVLTAPEGDRRGARRILASWFDVPKLSGLPVLVDPDRGLVPLTVPTSPNVKWGGG